MLLMAQPDAELASRLLELRQYIDQLELECSQLAAEFNESKHWEHQGSNSAIDWMRFHCHMTSNAAADRVAVGERAAEMPESLQAMQAGEIGFAHLTVMARTANAVGEAFDEAKLLALARENSPGKFHYKCLHYRHSVNSKQYAKEQAELAETNTLHMNRRDDGSFFLTGFLDPIGGAVVRSALEPLARTLGKDDHRLRPQRMADALIELAGHQQTIQMQVTSSIETLLDLTGAPGAETEFSLPISSKTVERWACDCSLTRVLLKGWGGIDSGRAERTIKGPRRRALVARDQHCRWTDCERPASACDGHHLNHWIRGGGGEIENQVLLCHRHHWMVHEGNWQLVKTDDGRMMPIAPTFHFARSREPD